MATTFESLVEEAASAAVTPREASRLYDRFNALWVQASETADPSTWQRLVAVARSVAHYVFRYKQIPYGQQSALELAARAFLSRAAAPLDFADWVSSNTRHYLLLSATREWLSREDGDQRFKVGSFIVHNTVVLQGTEVERIKRLISLAESRLKSSGIRSVGLILYGDVILTGQILSDRNLAYYQPEDDTIVLRSLIRGSSVELFNFIHELGHRYYAKVLTGREQALWLAWDSHLRRKKAQLPDVGDSLPFKVTGFGSEPPMVTGIRSVQGELRFYLTDAEFVTDVQIRNWYSKRSSEFPTLYSARSPEEHFCEAFAAFCSGSLADPHLSKFTELFA